MCSGMVFFFKQKTAYEMRISDWSSDVCSSDLVKGAEQHGQTEPQDEMELETRRKAGLAEREEEGEKRGDGRGDEHHRIARKVARIEFRHRVAHRGDDERGAEHRGWGGHDIRLLEELAADHREMVGNRAEGEAGEEGQAAEDQDDPDEQADPQAAGGGKGAA